MSRGQDSTKMPCFWREFGVNGYLVSCGNDIDLFHQGFQMVRKVVSLSLPPGHIRGTGGNARSQPSLLLPGEILLAVKQIRSATGRWQSSLLMENWGYGHALFSGAAASLKRRTASKNARIFSQGVDGGMSQPEEIMKLGHRPHFFSRAVTAARMDSGVPSRNSPAGSIFPRART